MTDSPWATPAAAEHVDVRARAPAATLLVGLDDEPRDVRLPSGRLQFRVQIQVLDAFQRF